MCSGAQIGAVTDLREPEMPKICLIGAGSTVFARNILSDVLSNPDLSRCEIALYDIDKERLSTSEVMTRRICQALSLADNVNVRELTVVAALTGNRDYIYHAAAMDPHTAAELSLAEIEKLVGALIKTHGSLLPDFKRGAA